MTLVVASGTPVEGMMSGIGGTDAKGILLDIAIQVGESLIRNYVNEQIVNAKKKIYEKADPRKTRSKARGNIASKYWRRYNTNYKAGYNRKFGRR